MKRKFKDPSNLMLIFKALKREAGDDQHFLSEEERRKGDALLAEWRASSPLDDRRLGAASIVSALEAHPEDISAVRVAATIAPQEIQSLVFMQGVVEAVARDSEGGPAERVGLLF